MFQATRRRLALWYTAVTATLLVIFASGMYFYVRFTLIDRVDDTLSHVVEVVQRSLVIEPVNLHSEGGPLRVNVEASLRDGTATGEDDHIDLEWFSPTGELLWSTLTEPLQIPLSFMDSARTVHLSPDQVLRQVTHRVEVGRQVLGFLRVSHPWFEVTRPARQLVLDLLLGTAAMIGTVAAIGWFLSGLAMQPMRESYQRLKQFTADASHELRNPIAIIQTNVQVALSDPEPDLATQHHHFEVIERLTRRLGRLVDDLLFLARQDSGIAQSRTAQVDLSIVLAEVVEEQQTFAQAKNIALSLEPIPKAQPPSPTGSQADLLSSQASSPPTLAPLKGQSDWSALLADRDQMTRLFTNLISNAVQYTPAGGKVTVNLQQTGRGGATNLQVTVRDTGIGIPADRLPQIFERFYRVDPARRHSASAGSGLGLAIVQAIVENHRGQIQVESAPNQGTTVIVTLPQRHEDIL